MILVDKYLSPAIKIAQLALSLGALALALNSNRPLIYPSAAVAFVAAAILFIRKHRVRETGQIKVALVTIIGKNILRRESYLILMLALAAAALSLAGTLDGASSLLLLSILLLTVDLDLFSSNAGKFIGDHLLNLSKRGISMPEAGKLFGLKATSFAVFEKSTAVFAGEPRVASIIPVKELSGETCIGMAHALISKDESAFAKAIKAEAAKMKVDSLEVLDIQPRPDLGGSEGTLLGRRLLLGNARFMAENKVDLIPVSNWIKVTAEAGEIAIFLAIEDKVEGLIALQDDLVPDIKQTVEYLKQRDIRTVLLTGDSTALGEQLKNSIGFDEAVSDKTAPEKNEYLSSLRSSGREVLFVTKPISQTGRTKHDILVFLTDHRPKIAAVPNEISSADGLSDLIYLFKMADELHGGIFKSNRTILIFAVASAMLSGALFLFNLYAGVFAAAALRLADIPLYRKLVTTLEKYVRNV